MKWIDGPRHMIAQYHPTWQIVVCLPNKYSIIEKEI